MFCLSSLESFLGYTFRNPEFLSRALTHRSINLNPEINADHLEFIGSSSFYLGILYQSILQASAATRGWELIRMVDQICSSTENINRLFYALKVNEDWKTRDDLCNNIEERLWLIYAICGALYQDGGYPAVLCMARMALEKIKFSTKVLPLESRLPWGPWSNRVTIKLDLLNFVFPRNFSTGALRLMPWALETHLKPGVYNQRSSQLFELGEAVLRWMVDLKLWRDKILEPSKDRHLHRKRILSQLGLGPRQDQAYASCFGAQDWRRQSLDHRVHSLKNLLGAVFVADGETAAINFAQLILNKPVQRETPGSSYSVVVSHAA